LEVGVSLAWFFTARKRDNAIMKLAKKSNVEVELLTMSGI